MSETTPSDRSVIAITGDDRAGFLQGLITNDPPQAGGTLVYAALLSPQGKYLADFFIHATGDSLLLDVKSNLAEALLRRLSMYRLRAKVGLAPLSLAVTRGTGPAPVGSFADPRHPALGWRAYGPMPQPPVVDWDALRVAHLIPETGIELIPDESYILEAGFERLHGVDFRKGCYVGQEVTARMKHKTELRKGLVQVRVAGAAPVGTGIFADGKAVGTLFTRSGDRALAYLRFDKAPGPMQAGEATVTFHRDAAAS